MPDEIPTTPVNGITRYRQDKLDETISKLEDELDDLKKTVNEQAVTIASLKERLSIFSMAQSALTIVVGAVAAFIGRLP